MIRKILFLLFSIIFFQNSASAQSYLRQFNDISTGVEMNGFVYFGADDGKSGMELWRSDGTTNGTTIVKDIAPGSASSLPQLRGEIQLKVYKNGLYFSANDGNSGMALWKSDGTAEGTKLVKRVSNDASVSRPNAQFTIFNNLLYFVGPDSNNGNQYALYRTDGTNNGTIKVSEATMLISNPVATSEMFYFKMGSSFYQINKQDKIVKVTGDDLDVAEEGVPFNAGLLFKGQSATGKKGVYVTKANNPSAELLEIFTGNKLGDFLAINNLIAFNNDIYFSVTRPENNEETDFIRIKKSEDIYKGDGTAEGTSLLKSFPFLKFHGDKGLSAFKQWNGKLYFGSRTLEANHYGVYDLWSTNGTSEGTLKLGDLLVNEQSRFIESEGKLYFINHLANTLHYTDSNNQVHAEFKNNPKNVNYLFEGLSSILPYEGLGYIFFGAMSNGPITLVTNKPRPQLAFFTEDNSYEIHDEPLIEMESLAGEVSKKKLTIKNTGNQEALLREIAISGANFYVNGKMDAIIPAGGQASFDVVYYSPIEAKTTSAMLMVKSDDPFSSNRLIRFNGRTVGLSETPDAMDSIAFEKAIIFNDNYKDFTLSSTTLSAINSANTSIGSFEIKGNRQLQFSLVSGLGDTDNALFKIENGVLKNVKTLHYNSQPAYTIRVKTEGDEVYEKNFTISVLDDQNNIPDETCEEVVFFPKSYRAVGYIGEHAIIIIGQAGLVMRSDNGGQDWESIDIGIEANEINHFLQISTPGEQTAYIRTLYQVWKTEDAGKTWFPLLSERFGSYVSSIDFISPDIGFMIRESLHKTVDGGMSWYPIQILNNSIQKVLFFNDKNGFIASITQNGNNLLRTQDAGESFESLPINLPDNSTVTAINFVDETTGFLSLSNGDLLKSTDGGDSWAKVAKTEMGLIKMTFTTATEGLGLLQDYRLVNTNDGGLTWSNSLQQPGLAADYAINKQRNSTIAVGGSSNMFLKQGTGNWNARSEQMYPGGGRIIRAQDNVFDIITHMGDLYRSADFGLTWSKIAVSEMSSLGSAYFLSDNIGYYYGGNKLKKTIDGGKSFQEISSDRITPIKQLYFINETVGFSITKEYEKLMRTNNGGDTWSYVDNMNYAIVKIQFFDQNNGYAIGRSSVIFKTTDQGVSWQQLDLGSEGMSAAYFINKDVGLFVDGIGKLKRTSDGGINWTEIQLPQPAKFNLFSFKDEQNGIAMPYHTGEIFETNDGGLTWKFKIKTEWNFDAVTSSGDEYLVMRTNHLGKLFVKRPPVNVGVINGVTKVMANSTVHYTLPLLDQYSVKSVYNWSVSGPALVEKNNNQLSVSWKEAGKYTITANAFNNCSVGESKTIEVEVIDAPEPEISGPEQVSINATNVIYRAGTNQNTYIWSVTGAKSFVADKNQVSVNWGAAGTGVVKLTEIDTDLGFKKSIVLNVEVNEQEQEIPANSFNVKIVSATCKGSANGIIQINAIAKGNYVASINGPGLNNKTYDFSEQEEVKNLVAGTYDVCLSIKGNTNFKRCYSVVITEPKDLAVFTQVDKSNQSVTLNLSGADNYIVELNGERLITPKNQLTLKLARGKNKLKVYTDLTCQGVVEEVINWDGVIIYPNPFVDLLKIDLSTIKANKVLIEILALNGRTLISQEYHNDNGIVSLDMTAFEGGMYILKLKADGTESVHKILKK